MLIGKVGVKAGAGIVPIASVDIAGGIAALGRAKELPVGWEVVPSPQIVAIGKA